MKTIALGIFGLGISGVIAACSSQPSEDQGAASIKMHLARSGSKLVIDDCKGCKEGCLGKEFPNQEKVEEMTVTVTDEREIKVDCGGKKEDCDSPVITKINPDKKEISVLAATDKTVLATIKPSARGGRAIDRGGKSGDAEGNHDWKKAVVVTDERKDDDDDDGHASLKKTGKLPTPDTCEDVFSLWCSFVNDRLESKKLSDFKLDCSNVTDALYGDLYFPQRDGDPVAKCYSDLITPQIRDFEKSLGFDSDDLPGIDEEEHCKKAMIRIVQNVRDAYIDANVCTTNSPLVLDLDGNGVSMGSAWGGVPFDLLGTGSTVRTAWPEGADAWLVLDRNGNGSVDGMSELFGTATAGHRWNHGFEPLAELDDNADGVINHHDRAFLSLTLWHDENRDGTSSPSELISLSEAGIAAIETRPASVRDSSSHDVYGNRIPLRAEFVRTDGARGAMADVFPRWKDKE